MASFIDGQQFKLTISYFLGQYLLKEELHTGESDLFSSLTLLNIDKTWYVDSDFSLPVDMSTSWLNYATVINEETATYTLSLYADPNEGLSTPISSICVTNIGNIVSPNGASVIFGAETDEDNAIDITHANQHTFNPYNIVIVEEDTDETLPADQITFDPEPNSALTSDDVQNAINELEQIVYATTPVFTQEVWELTEGATSQSLTGTFSPATMMVYYNGLLINDTIHFSLTGKIIQFLDFSAEAGDILTVIGLSSSGGVGGTNINAASLIGGSY